MAETRKTTKPKTKPTKKPASKPATKPKETKPATTTTKSSTTKITSATTSKHNPGKIVLIAIIIVAIIAVVTGVVVCVISGCTKNETVMIENGKGDKIESKYASLEGYNYKVLIPTDFKTLTAEEIAEDYGTTEAPELVYANEENTVNVAFSKPSNNLKNDEIKEYLDAMKTILSTSMDVISADMVEKDGHNVGILKIVSELEDEKIYNQMAFFSYDDKLAIITFNCRDKIRNEWEKVGDAIIDSIKF